MGQRGVRLVWLAAFIACTAPALARAQEPAPYTSQLKLSGSARVRYDTIANQARPGFDRTDDMVALRTSVTAEYDAGSVKVVGQVQDSRAYGVDSRSPLSTNDVDAVELVQAYVQAGVRGPAGTETSATLQAGRFTMMLGSWRLVAGDDFRNTSNAYTGARLDLTAPGGWSGTLIYTRPVMRRPDDLASLLNNKIGGDRDSRNLVLWGGLVTKTGLPGKLAFDATFLGLDERDQPGRPTHNRRLRTLDVRLIRAAGPGRFDFEVEGAYQYGSIRADLAPAAPALDVSAGYAHMEAGYSFSRAWRVSLDYDWASGDGGSPGRYGRFDSLYGNRRGDFSPPGLFAAIGRSNISAPGVHLEYTAQRLDALLHYQALWLASSTDAFSTTGVRDASGASGRFAGQTIDARLRYWLVPDALRLEANAVYLFKARFLKAAPNAPPGGDTRYLALSLLANF